MIKIVANRIDKIKRKEKLEQLIELIKDILKKEESYLEMCKEYGKDVDFVDDINITFDDELDVSAKTINGDVFINGKLIEKGDLVDIIRYFVHEITHVAQQEAGTVKGKFNKEDYLDDPNEQEAFQYQIQYMNDYVSEKEIQDYLEHLLDHHNISSRKERIDKIKKLTENI